MKQRFKIYVLTVLISAPFAFLWYYLAFPPQCPESYTQAHMDAGRCIVGANIGGVPIFVGAVLLTLLVVRWVIGKWLAKQG